VARVEFDGEILGEAPAILEVLGSDAYGPLSRRNKGYHLRPEAQEALIGHWASWARRTGRCLLLCGGWNNMGPKAPSRVYRGSSPGRGKREAFLGTETALELRRAYFEASIRRILEAYLYGRLPDEPREELPRPEESKIRLLEGRVGSRLQGASGSFPQGLTREGVQEEELRASAELLRGWLESEPTCSSHGSSFWIDCLPKDYPYYGSRPIRGLYAWIEALVVRTGLVEYDLDEASRSGGRRAVRASRGSRDGGLPESEERLFPSEESKRLRGPAEGRIQTSAESGIWASAVKLRTWLLGEPSCVAYGSSYWIECLPRDYPHYEGRPSRRLRAWIDALVETGLVGYDFEEAQRPGGRPAIRAVRGLEVPD